MLESSQKAFFFRFPSQIFPEIIFVSNFQIFRSSSFYKQHVQQGRVEAVQGSLFVTFYQEVLFNPTKLHKV